MNDKYIEPSQLLPSASLLSEPGSSYTMKVSEGKEPSLNLVQPTHKQITTFHQWSEAWEVYMIVHLYV